jgi:hypothetical protein
MPRLTLKSLFVAFLVLAPRLGAADKTPPNYPAVDKYALKTPKEAEESVASLAKYLVKTAKNDREKTRAIYRWVTDRLEYNVEGLLAKKLGDNSVENVLKTRLCVCQGYANVFEALAKEAGLEVVKVYGRSKGYASEEEDDETERVGHVWNAVKIDDNWHVVDPTWGAGGIDKKKFVKKFNEYYFFPAPDQIIYTHFPREEKWQLLPDALSEKDFDAQPKVSSRMFEMGVTTVALKKALGEKDFPGLVKVFSYPGKPVTLKEVPLKNRLKVGSKYHFVIEATDFPALTASGDGRTIAFTRRGKVFEATIIAPSGKITIDGAVPAGGSKITLHRILEYVGE